MLTEMQVICNFLDDEEMSGSGGRACEVVRTALKLINSL